ncbi:MAG: beta-galactosidase, partial [Novosphingobium sp.]|nr:beta-galactosidase [Novosphingobium sp.]
MWVNGVHLGEHRGGFGRFRFDVTAVWKPGAANLIAVRADNTKAVPGTPTGETIPLSGDFFVAGGIYRPVALVTVPDASFDLLDHGGPGIYARATVAANAAQVTMLARLRNLGAGPRTLQMLTTIADASGREVARASQPVTLPTGASEASAALSVPSPHLWNGTADPYLYTITATLTDNGRVIDRVAQPLGIRSFR